MISYFTQITLCWGLFYLLYTLWLRKETFFHLNRWYLLSTLVAGLFIPLMEFQVFFDNGLVPSALPSNYLETITVTAQAFENNLAEIVITPVEQSWNIQLILTSIYCLGILFFASRFIYGISQIIRLAYHGRITRKASYFLVQTNQIHLPFSFMNYLFWSKSVPFNKEDHEKILRHELCHIKGNHSIDVLLTELLCIFLWCIPFIFLYKKALKNIHEYLADDAVLKDTPTKKYGQLLLKQSQSGLQIAQANNFIHSQLKKRIIMMTKNKSQRYALLKYTAILPLALFLVFSISAENKLPDFKKDNNTSSIQADTIPLTTAKGEVFKVVEEMPRFPGCEEEEKATRKDCAQKKMLMHIYTNIKYPAEAREANIEGTVVVSFIVEKDGSLSNKKVVRKIGGGCDEEVLRVIDGLPNFIPGKQRGKIVRVQYLLPVKYKLEGGSAPKEKASSLNLAKSIDKQFEEKPLIILDGETISNIEEVDPNSIKDIHVIKGEKALEQYGLKGKNGVVVINTKKDQIKIIGMTHDKIPPPPPPSAPKAPGDKIAPPPPPPPPPPAFPDESGVFRVVEQMPMFPGSTNRESSNKALVNFVYKNLKYPKAAKQEMIEGVAVVSFIITKEGYVKDPTILRSIGGGTDEEVLKVVESMNIEVGPWTPGVQRGRKVNVQFNLPVRFMLDKEIKKDKVSEAPKDMTIDQIAPASAFEQIEVFPNPTSGKINIQVASKKNSPTSITITDQKGTQVYQGVFKDAEISITDLELKDAASGILYITFQKDGEIETREIVLQK